MLAPNKANKAKVIEKVTILHTHLCSLKRCVRGRGTEHFAPSELNHSICRSCLHLLLGER